MWRLLFESVTAMRAGSRRLKCQCLKSSKWKKKRCCFHLVTTEHINRWRADTWFLIGWLSPADAALPWIQSSWKRRLASKMSQILILNLRVTINDKCSQHFWLNCQKSFFSEFQFKWQNCDFLLLTWWRSRVPVNIKRYQSALAG